MRGQPLPPDSGAHCALLLFFMNSSQFRDYEPETRSLLQSLTAAGFVLLLVDNGGTDVPFTGDLDSFVEECMGADEARLYVRAPDGRRVGLFLVYGNSPGELVADHHIHAQLETVVVTHGKQWDNCPQPMRERV